MYPLHLLSTYFNISKFHHLTRIVYVRYNKNKSDLLQVHFIRSSLDSIVIVDVTE